MFLIARVLPPSDLFESFEPRIIRKEDITLVELDPSDKSRCYIVAKNQPEDNEAGLTAYLCDSPIEEIAQALECETTHMKNDFSPKLAKTKESALHQDCSSPEAPGP